MTTTEDFITSREFRDERLDRINVLEKVKSILLLPGTEFATINQVADYYEVDREAVKKVVQRHRDEFDLNGLATIKGNDVIKKIENELGLDNLSKPKKDCNSNEVVHGDTMSPSKNIDTKVISLEKVKGGIEVNGVRVNYTKNFLFNRRAILLTGMLLTDSKVAKEVRNQLLNIEEKTSVETKTEDINKEHDFFDRFDEALARGNIEEAIKCQVEHTYFMKRHIAKLEEENKVLAGEILKWDDRSKLNFIVRKLAIATDTIFGKVWTDLYKNLKYKYHIDLTARGKKPYIQYIKEDEWTYVNQTLAAMCKIYDVDPETTFAA